MAIFIMIAILIIMVVILMATFIIIIIYTIYYNYFYYNSYIYLINTIFLKDLSSYKMNKNTFFSIIMLKFDAMKVMNEIHFSLEMSTLYLLLYCESRFFDKYFSSCLVLLHLLLCLRACKLHIDRSINEKQQQKIAHQS